MQLAANVFDVWAFARGSAGPQFLLLHTSIEKADRHFNGGRFWQIPSGVVAGDETIAEAIVRDLGRYGMHPRSIWAGEHAYIIYNRRFAEMQIIGVYAAEVTMGAVHLDPAEHSAYEWLSMDACLERVHYRGLKEGLRSVNEYITGVNVPAKELCLYQVE